MGGGAGQCGDVMAVMGRMRLVCSEHKASYVTVYAAYSTALNTKSDLSKININV